MNCALLIIVLIPGNTESAKAKTRTGHYITFYAYVEHLGHAAEYADAPHSILTGIAANESIKPGCR